MTDGHPRLQVTDSLGRRQIPIDKPLLTIGRRTESDVRVAGVGVSRLHAEILSENGACRLRDCASKFGTFINGRRAEDHVLKHGDRIRLGEERGHGDRVSSSATKTRRASTAPSPPSASCVTSRRCSKGFARLDPAVCWKTC
jgi:pSer/pThr/pTyr-binding forkhead associated (FHA) protein